jgi:hypothetical protein
VSGSFVTALAAKTVAEACPKKPTPVDSQIEGLDGGSWRSAISAWPTTSFERVGNSLEGSMTCHYNLLPDVS